MYHWLTVVRLLGKISPQQSTGLGPGTVVVQNHHFSLNHRRMSHSHWWSYFRVRLQPSEAAWEHLDHARAKIARHPKFRLLSLLCLASNHKMTLKYFVDLDEIFRSKIIETVPEWL
eukprot:sb/3476588/